MWTFVFVNQFIGCKFTLQNKVVALKVIRFLCSLTEFFFFILSINAFFYYRLFYSLYFIHVYKFKLIIHIVTEFWFFFHYFCSEEITNTPPKQVPQDLSPLLTVLISSAVVLVVLILVAFGTWLYCRRRKGTNCDTCTCKHMTLSTCWVIVHIHVTTGFLTTACAVWVMFQQTCTLRGNRMLHYNIICQWIFCFFRKSILRCSLQHLLF